MKVLKNAKFTGNIKINDTNTNIYFQAYDDGVLQKLNASQCSFKIKNDTGYLITISNVSTETDYITFKSNELKSLPVGTYYLELWVKDSTGTYIYPDESFCKLRINENVTVAQGTIIPTISLEEYENKLKGYVDSVVSDSALNSLKNFGGRNLLLDSRDNRNKSMSEWSYNANNVISGETFLNSIISKTNQAWDKNVGAYNPYNLVKRNIYNTVDDFVFSVYVKKDSDVVLSDSNIDFYSSATNKSASHIETGNISDSWSRIYISFKFTKQASNISDAQNAGDSIRFEPNTNIQNGYLYFACPKLEKGTIPTDYTPAPEDLQSEIDTIKSQIQALQIQ